MICQTFLKNNSEAIAKIITASALVSQSINLPEANGVFGLSSGGLITIFRIVFYFLSRLIGNGYQASEPNVIWKRDFLQYNR